VQAAIKAFETDDARVTGAVLPDGQRCASGHRHRCTKPLFTERSRT
jgi:hypothetical protein